MRVLRVAASVLAMLMLVACAAPKIPYERASADVKTVGIVTPQFPDSAGVVLASSIGQSFGLVGALVDAGIRAARESEFNAVVQEQKFSAQNEFLTALTAALEQRGYQVAMVPWTRNSSDFLERYPIGTSPKVDAYLDVASPYYGYIAAGMGSSTPYRPYFGFRARLISAKGAAVLMQDSIVYNPIGPGATQVVSIAPDPKHRFTDFDALKSDPKNAVQGLEVAARRSAETLAKLLQ